jgi:hypothetical protein
MPRHAPYLLRWPPILRRVKYSIPWKGMSLPLASTAVLHTSQGVQLWLLLPRHPNPKTLGQLTNAPF